VSGAARARARLDPGPGLAGGGRVRVRRGGASRGAQRAGEQAMPLVAPVEHIVDELVAVIECALTVLKFGQIGQDHDLACTIDRA
jgi:hypothetical protein